MGMDYIRRTYGVPAKRGGRVQFTAADYKRCGTIVGARGQYLRVRWDEDNRTTSNHPTWMLAYLEAPKWEVRRMPTNRPETNEPAVPGHVVSTERLGPLPETSYVLGIGGDGYSDDRCTTWPAWDDDAVRAYALAEVEKAVAAERARLCATIKAADDKASEGGYMLDSDDCISVILGTWDPGA